MTTPSGCCAPPASPPASRSSPTRTLTAAVERMHGRLSIVSAERIRDELDKIVMVDVPSVALWFVVRTGLAGEFLPELPGLALEQDPIHRHKDVLGHTLAVVDKTSPIRLLRLAALFHDVGKPRTRAITDGGVSFHHHEVVGARMTRTRMEALRYSARPTSTRSCAWSSCTCASTPTAWAGPTRPCAATCATPARTSTCLNELTRCDCTTRNAAKARALARRMDELEARIAELGEQEELQRPAPRPGRQPDHGAARHRPGPRRGPGPWTSSWSCASTRGRWARRRRRRACGPGGPSSRLDGRR